MEEIVVRKREHNGKFYCLNTKTGDESDRYYDTEEEAAAVATATNARIAAHRAAMKKLAAERRAERDALRQIMPTDFLTSRGDGWEGNG